MKKVNEILTNENSFFKKLKEVKPDLYYDLFEETKPDMLDGDILVTCGERYAAPLISYHKMDFVVDYILQRFSDNWQKVKNALFAEYDLFKPYSNATTTKQVTEGEKIDKSTATNKDGIVAFDSDTPKTANVTDNTDEATQNVNQTIITTVERDGNVSHYTNQSLIANEIELRKTSFVQIVIKDISTQITLDIY